MQGRYLVGAKDSFPQVGQHLEGQVKAFDRGPFRQRLRAAVLAGELVDPKTALKQLAGIRPRDRKDEPSAASAEERRLWRSLERLYGAYSEEKFDAEVVLPAAERQRLREELGWFGELALTPQGADPEARAEVVAPARRLALALIAGLMTGLGLAVLGLVGLVVLLALLFSRTIRRGFEPGSPYGAVYAETFAVWLVLFVGLLLLSGVLPAGRSQLLRSALFTLLSLVALAWPVWRGVPWGQVRRDVGLCGGRGPVREVLSGIAGYVLSLPLLAAGLIGMLVLIELQRRLGGGSGLGGEGSPAHPLVGMVADDWWVRVQVVLAASVTAPVVEETMFRGVLYRHLREATRAWGLGASVLASGLVNSFLFAVVHPQGLIAVPLLMGLALGFSVAREWRGTLIPCMVAHGLSNGLVTLLLLLALSG
jgi:membrane protease YdiL (CAAX protease family)